MNLLLLGRGQQTEDVLREIGENGADGAHQWATLRAANLIWFLGRCSDASVLLEELARGPESPAEQVARLAVEACVDAVFARCDAAAEKARAALDSGLLSDFHAMMASVALTMAIGALDRADDLTIVAEAALDRAMNVVPGVSHAVLVRKRLRPRMPTDRSDRRMRGDGAARRRLGS